MTIATETPTNTQVSANESTDLSPVSMEEGTPENTATNAEEAIAETEETEKDRSGLYKKLLVGLILVGFIVFVIVDTQTNNYVRNGIVAFLEWIENNIVAGVFCFIGVYFLATIFFVPGSILTLGAGFVFSAALDSLGWGILLGSGAVFLGASLGAIAAFLLSRYLLRDVVQEKLTQKYKVFEALDKALETQGLKITVLCRLSPVVPFNVFNYGMGVSAVKFWDYTIACIAMLPGTILYVFLGASAGSLSGIAGGDEEEDGPTQSKAVTITIIVVSAVFGILALAIFIYYAKKELNKLLEEKPEEESAEISQGGDDDEDDDEDNSNKIAQEEAAAPAGNDEEQSM